MSGYREAACEKEATIASAWVGSPEGWEVAREWSNSRVGSVRSGERRELKKPRELRRVRSIAADRYAWREREESNSSRRRRRRKRPRRRIIRKRRRSRRRRSSKEHRQPVDLGGVHLFPQTFRNFVRTRFPASDNDRASIRYTIVKYKLQ